MQMCGCLLWVHKPSVGGMALASYSRDDNNFRPTSDISRQLFYRGPGTAYGVSSLPASLWFFSDPECALFLANAGTQENPDFQTSWEHDSWHRFCTCTKWA